MAEGWICKCGGWGGWGQAEKFCGGMIANCQLPFAFWRTFGVPREPTAPPRQTLHSPRNVRLRVGCPHGCCPVARTGDALVEGK